MFDRDFIDNFLKDYELDEKERIQRDSKIAQQLSFEDAKPVGSEESPIYLATAGGPGSLKSTTLEAYLRGNGLTKFVYADPDQVYLKNMIFTYRRSLSNLNFAIAKSSRECLKDAYNKWRGASNYICHQILQIAFGQADSKSDKYSIAHGTTSTNVNIGKLYSKIKTQGYQINLLLCYSPDEIRQEAISKRETEQGFVQVDPKEVISKGADFPRRFNLYFEHADQIHFYWNDKLIHGILPSPCARFTKTAAGPVLEVIDAKDWHLFCHKYLADTKQYGIEICPAFYDLIPKAVLLGVSPQNILTHTGFYSSRNESKHSEQPSVGIIQRFP